MIITGSVIGIFAIVMGALVGTMAVRQDGLWPLSFALVGCAIGVAVAVALSR